MNAQDHDCGVIFDNGDRLLFLPFRSADVKAPGAGPRPSPPPSPAENATKSPGWLGLFASPSGGMDAKTPTGESVADTFRFGVAAIGRGSSRSGTLASYCSPAAQDVNLLYGLTGLAHGVVNNPLDRDRWEPPPVAQGGGPGLIQAAAHWSAMARSECPQIAGIIIDDFLGAYYEDDPYSKLNISDVRDVKAALVGKPVDNATGKVDHSAPAVTPHLQLLVVAYTFELNSSLCRKPRAHGVNECLYDNMGDGLFGADAVDGVSFWPGGELPAFPLAWSQDESSARYPSFVGQLRRMIPPSATVLTGIYLAGSGKEGDSPHGEKYVHWMSQAGVRASFAQAAQLYSAGKTNGSLLFSGPWLAAPARGHAGINRSQWDKFALPSTLDAEVWSRLGTASVRVTSAAGAPLADARVVVRFRPEACEACSTLVTRKATDANGTARFGGSTEGTHEVAVSLPGFREQTAAVRIAPRQSSAVTVRLVTDI